MTEQSINTFLSKLSFAGLEALYAAKLSFEKNKAFDRDHYATNAYSTTADYLSGIFTVCYALDLISYNRTGTVLTITKVDPFISASVEKYLTALAEKNPSWQQYIEKTQKYFN